MRRLRTRAYGSSAVFLYAIPILFARLRKRRCVLKQRALSALGCASGAAPSNSAHRAHSPAQAALCSAEPIDVLPAKTMSLSLR